MHGIQKNLRRHWRHLRNLWTREFSSSAAHHIKPLGRNLWTLLVSIRAAKRSFFMFFPVRLKQIG
jgi:hypothetical protein